MHKLFALYLCFCGLFVHATEYHVSVRGDDGNPGTANRPFRTIGHAAGIAQPGDTITVHHGIYRELVAPVISGTAAKRITYRAAKGEHPEIRGSEQISNWVPESPGVWKATIPAGFFGQYNPYTDLISGDWFFPVKRQLHTGEVYLNGQALYEAPSLINVQRGIPEAAPIGTPRALSSDHTWFTEQKDGQIVIYARFGHLDPGRDTVEINVRPSCFYPLRTGVNYLTVCGFKMKQAATQWAAPTAEQVGAIGTNWSKGWIIENNVICDSKCAGITLGKDRASGENPWSADKSRDGADIYNDLVKKVAARDWNKQHVGSHIVHHNEIFNCGAAGICGSLGAIFSEISYNNVHDIYTRRSFYGAEMGGIKLHGAIDVLIAGNKVSNAFIGLWLDWMAQGTKITGNLFSDNDYVDFFPEVDHGPYTFQNNIMLSPYSLRDWSEGGTFEHNLFGGKLSRAPQDRRTPYFKPHSTELLGIKAIRGGDNRFTGNYFVDAGPEVGQPLMHPWDKSDSLQSYGLSLYKGAARPVTVSRNHTIAKAAVGQIIQQQFPDISSRYLKR